MTGSWKEDMLREERPKAESYAVAVSAIPNVNRVVMVVEGPVVHIYTVMDREDLQDNERLVRIEAEVQSEVLDFHWWPLDQHGNTPVPEGEVLFSRS